MRIGIISDTHIPSRARQLPAFVAQAFAGVDRILHAGDINDYSVLRELNAIAPTESVAGNTDPVGMVEFLGFEKLLTLAGYESASPMATWARQTTPTGRIIPLGKADIVVFAIATTLRA